MVLPIFLSKLSRDNVPIEDVDRIERELIQEHNTLVPNGYNIRLGGSGIWVMK